MWRLNLALFYSMVVVFTQDSLNMKGTQLRKRVYDVLVDVDQIKFGGQDRDYYSRPLIG
jgi:hypothetical protein